MDQLTSLSSVVYIQDSIYHGFWFFYGSMTSLDSTDRRVYDDFWHLWNNNLLQ